MIVNYVPHVDSLHSIRNMNLNDLKLLETIDIDPEDMRDMNVHLCFVSKKYDLILHYDTDIEYEFLEVLIINATSFKIKKKESDKYSTNFIKRITLSFPELAPQIRRYVMKGRDLRELVEKERDDLND